jgi:hypothetical protein
LTATKGIANNTAAEYYAVDSNGALATGGQWYWSIFESNSNVTINSNTGVLSILNSAESYIFYVIFEIRGFDETFFSQQISLVVSEAPSAPNII